MGRGDKKTAKGKRTMGSYGNTRKRKEDAKPIVVAKVKKVAKPTEVKAEKPVKKQPRKRQLPRKLINKKSCLTDSFFFEQFHQVINIYIAISILIENFIISKSNPL